MKGIPITDHIVTQAVAYFARVSQDLLRPKGEEPTAAVVARKAVEVVPGCEYAGLSVRRRHGRIETQGPTDPIVEQCDEFQYELKEGPCVATIRDAESYVVDDTRTEQRWRAWAEAIADRGMYSAMSVRLSDDLESVSALNLYASKPHAFDPDSVEIALIYAVHATAALESAKLVTGLRTALHSRHRIGVAQGMLMQRYGLSMDSAFELLRRYSSHANVKLRQVAEIVIASKDIPDNYSVIQDASNDEAAWDSADAEGSAASTDPEPEQT